ncbi:MAG: DUF2794 domain-containing protein [Rhodovibrionaceae bacterium]|nr:DUF2794 domain-containing protein [Rhodovibrionaceae bacterium]
MSRLYYLEEHRRRIAPTFFDRRELNLLLSLYSRRVMNGEWRDYAIDQKDGMAMFSVFRHSHDRPLYSITKKPARGSREVEYAVFCGRERLARAKSLSEALAVFQERLKLVT